MATGLSNGVLERLWRRRRKRSVRRYVSVGMKHKQNLDEARPILEIWGCSFFYFIVGLAVFGFASGLSLRRCAGLVGKEIV